MNISNKFISSLSKSYIVVDEDFTIKDASEGFLIQRQIDKNSLKKLNLAEISKRNPRELITTFKAVFQTGKSCGPTHPLITDDGKVKFIIHEISGEELMDSREAADVLERITDGFFTLGHNWSFTNVNPVAKALLKKNKSEIIGRAFYEIFPLKESEVFMKNFFLITKTKRPSYFEAEYEDTIYSVQAYPQRGGGIAVFFRDITEKKRAEKKLENALETKNEFISVASHELKTPLTALKLQIEMAKRSLEQNGSESMPAERLKVVINRTHHDIQRLSRLVEDMLDVSRINTGNFNMNFEFFNLEEFFDDFLTRTLPALPGIQNLLKIKINAPVMVRWDKFRMEQVILNLLTNALRYGENSEIDLDVKTGGGYAYLSVKDGGPGISKENQQVIFERYERGSIKRTSEGFGLGLYLCNKIIKHHQGEISLKSRIGEGTTFTLTMPLCSV